MERQFEVELRKVKDHLIEMGAITETMIGHAIEAMGLGNCEDKLEEIDPLEQKVNNYQLHLDDDVIKYLALQQPVAQDLRFVLMASKIVNEMERVADLSVNVCQSSRYLECKSKNDVPATLEEMAIDAKEMFALSLDAYAKQDTSLAQCVLDSDEKVDQLKRRFLDITISEMNNKTLSISAGISFILISRNWERIADHATNIAEEVIYLALGKEVRHRQEKHDQESQDT